MAFFFEHEINFLRSLIENCFNVCVLINRGFSTHTFVEIIFLKKAFRKRRKTYVFRLVFHYTTAHYNIIIVIQLENSIVCLCGEGGGVGQTENSI